MHLKELVRRISREFERLGIACCILRNYDGLPNDTLGNDIDMLVMPRDINRACDFLMSLDDVKVINVLHRHYVCATLLSGIEGRSSSIIEIDFVTKLAWKGVEYLRTEDVLRRSRLVERGGVKFSVPDPVDEALISTFSSLLLSNFVKKRYVHSAAVALAENERRAETVLFPVFGPRLSRALLKCLIQKDAAGTLSLARLLRLALFVNGFRARPFETVVGMACHYIAEIGLLFSANTVFLMCVLGPDGVGKSSIIGELTHQLSACSKSVEVIHLKPVYFAHKRIEARGVVTDPHRLPARSALVSIVKLTLWILELWMNNIFDRRRNFTIKIFDRYIYDVLVDPMRYRCSARPIFVRALVRLAPRPDLSLILYAPLEVVISRKQEVARSETDRQLAEYLHLAAELYGSSVVSTNSALSAATMEAMSAVCGAMQRKCGVTSQQSPSGSAA